MDGKKGGEKWPTPCCHLQPSGPFNFELQENKCSRGTPTHIRKIGENPFWQRLQIFLIGGHDRTERNPYPKPLSSRRAPKLLHSMETMIPEKVKHEEAEPRLYP